MKGRRIDIIVNGKPISVLSGATVAVALMNEGISGFRESVTGETRGPLCGMGICSECRVTINDVPQQRACLCVVEHGMRIETGVGVAKERQQPVVRRRRNRRRSRRNRGGLSRR